MEYFKDITKGTYKGIEYEIIDAKVMIQKDNDMCIGFDYKTKGIDELSEEESKDFENYLGNLLTTALNYAKIIEDKLDGNQI